MVVGPGKSLLAYLTPELASLDLYSKLPDAGAANPLRPDGRLSNWRPSAREAFRHKPQRGTVGTDMAYREDDDGKGCVRVSGPSAIN